jgi:hypothetical protein
MSGGADRPGTALFTASAPLENILADCAKVAGGGGVFAAAGADGLGSLIGCPVFFAVTVLATELFAALAVLTTVVPACGDAIFSPP